MVRCLQCLDVVDASCSIGVTIRRVLSDNGSAFRSKRFATATGEGESGILVDVHPAELLKDAEWVAPSSLSDSVRMDSNNVLKHHS